MKQFLLPLLALVALALPSASALAANDLAQELDAYLTAYAEATGFMGSVLVARGDEVLLARGYGMADLSHGVANEADTVFRLGSLTKQFTAAAILRLQEEGRLDVEDTLDEYLPDYPNGDRITLAQLLSHTAGIPNYTALPSFEAFARQPHTTDTLIDRFRDLPLDFEPGAGFSYSNSGYVLLTAVIETVTGDSYADYVQDEFFEPLGMTRTAYDDAGEVVADRATGYVVDGAGYRVADFVDMSVPSGAGSLRGTVGDLLVWSRALAGGEVVSPQSYEAMTAPVAAMDPSGTSSYGYGLILSNEGGRRSVSHGGGIQGFATALVALPDEDLVVAVLSNVQTSPSGAIASGLAAIALGETVEMPSVREAVHVEPAVLQAYEGGYEIGPDVVADVTMEDGRLFLEIPGQGRYELLPESEDRFFLREMGASVRFVVEDGETVRFVVRQGDQLMPIEKVR